MTDVDWTGVDLIVEQWMAWLALGVTLRVPETFIRYCDVHQSTVRSLGEGWFERADEWGAFEAGHGYYGSTDHTTFDAASLRTELRSFATRCPDKVRPLDATAHEGIAATEALALARSGARAISPWFATSDRDARSTVVGRGGRAFCVTRRSELVRIEELPADHDRALQGLLIPGASLTEPDPTLAETAERYCARRDALLRELAADPRKIVRFSPEIFVKAGARLAGLLCRFNNPRWWVEDLGAHGLRSRVAYKVLRDEATRCEAIDPAAFDAIDALESRLAALDASIRDGELALRVDGFSRWTVWVDGIPRAVRVKNDVPVELSDEEPAAIRADRCVRYVCEGSDDGYFHPVDEDVRAKIRAWIAAKGR